MWDKDDRDDKAAAKAGLGLLALLALVAGAYYFYASEDAEDHRHQFKHWAAKRKREMMERVHQAEEFTQDQFNNVVEKILDRYEAVKDMDPEDLEELKADLKSIWRKYSSRIKHYH